jgi:uncharacterized membrane protein YdjX (TVP38/TMEM64 family)
MARFKELFIEFPYELVSYFLETFYACLMDETLEVFMLLKRFLPFLSDDILSGLAGLGSVFIKPFIFITLVFYGSEQLGYLALGPLLFISKKKDTRIIKEWD